MSDYLIKGETLTGIADAIRAKTGGTDPIMVSDMANQIGNITGGGSSETVIKEKSDVTGFALDPDFGYAYMDTAPSFHLEVGKTYRIVWDDQSWTCTAETITMDGFGSFACVGDLSSFGLSGNGEGFAIASSINTLMYTAFTDPAEKHSVAIYEVGSGGSSDDVRYVTFLNYDGSYLGKKAVAVGDNCADPIARGVFATPTKPSTAQYEYTHVGWANTANGAWDENATKAVTEDKTVYAAYASVVRTYAVRFFDDSGKQMGNTIQVAYGSDAIPPDTGRDGYTFNGWEPADLTIYGNTDFHGSWEKLSALYEFATVDNYAYDFDISPEGDRIVCSKGGGSANTTIDVFSLPNATKVTTQAYTPEFYQTGVGYDRTGEYLFMVANQSGGKKYLYKFKTSGTWPIDSITSRSATASYLKCSPVASKLAIGGSGSYGKYTATIIDTSTNSSVQTGQVFGNYSARFYSFSKDGQYVAMASDRKVCVFNASTATTVSTPYTDESSSSVCHISFSGDGEKLAVGLSVAPYVAIYNPTTGAKICDLSDYLDVQSGSKVFAEFLTGKNILVVGSGTTVKAFDMSGDVPQEIEDVPEYTGNEISIIKSNHTGNRIGIYGSSKTVIWGY